VCSWHEALRSWHFLSFIFGPRTWLASIPHSGQAHAIGELIPAFANSIVLHLGSQGRHLQCEPKWPEGDCASGVAQHGCGPGVVCPERQARVGLPQLPARLCIALQWRGAPLWHQFV